MSRLFYEILKSSHIPENTKTVIRGSTVLVADRVAEFYGAHDQEIWDERDDFPNVAPPWEKFFVEWKIPRIWNMPHFRRTVDESHLIKACGVFLNVSIRPESRPSVLHIPFLDAVMEIPENTHWLISGLIFTQLVGFDPCGGDLGFLCPIDSDGLISRQRDGKSAIVCISHKRLGSMDASGINGNILNVVWLALSFLHCRNVVIQPVYDERARTQKERRRRELDPVVRFYTLQIEGMERILCSEGGLSTNGLKRALHICRGHFKHYPEGSPGLFGHIHGTFWCPQHTRGTREAGMVVKDYEANPSVGEPA